MLSPLVAVFDKIIRTGAFRVRDAAGRVHRFGDGSGEPVAIALKDRRLEWQLVRDPELAAGEGYMQGRLVMEQGSVYDFIDLTMRNMALHPLPEWTQAFATLRRLRRRWDEYNDGDLARAHVAHHYDIDPRIYDLFLDKSRQYSCAYFSAANADLDEAQRAKQRHIAAKLRLGPGMRILDIGCGWGGLARYLAALSGGHVTGITLSLEQFEGARASPHRVGKGAVAFELADYRTIGGVYDRIVSVGMFEHVGSTQYKAYFTDIARLLSDEGVALVHAIGRLDGPASTNPFIAKWIFPGGALASLSELTAAIEGSGLFIADMEILRLHYAQTLRLWRERFLANREKAVAIAGEEFARMWEFYLAGCEAAFRYQSLMVFQVQLVKKIDSLPITRDYMLETERQLAARENGRRSPQPVATPDVRAAPGPIR